MELICGSARKKIMIIYNMFTPIAFFGGKKIIEDFKPSDLTGLINWLDADDSESVELSSGSNVSKWLDKSNSELEFTVQGSAPQYDSNKLTFNGSNQSLTTTSGLSVFNNLTTMTIFYIDRPNRRISSETMLTIGYSGFSNSDNFMGFNSNSSLYRFYARNSSGGFQNVNVNNDSTDRPTDSINKSIGIWNGTNRFQAYINGKDTGSITTVNTTPVTCNRISIGRSNPQSGFATNFFQGDIHELIIYNRELTTSEISQVESYLDNKWGL
jgi:hypothetical protein